MYIVSAAEMRELDGMVQRLGVPALILMENAGRALADHSERLLAGIRSETSETLIQSQQVTKCKTIAVLAGPGQNGGDGFCAARHLAARGHNVKVGFFGNKEQLPNEAFLNYQMLEPYPVDTYYCETMTPQEVLERLGCPDLIIDALLGIGAKGAPRFPIDMAIRWANSQEALVVACDMPSGVSADTGYAYSPSIRADVTVTMGLAKVGLVSYPGRMYAGNIVVENLSFPPGLLTRFGGLEEIQNGPVGEEAKSHNLSGEMRILAQAASVGKAGSLLPCRHANHHKGLSGHVLVIAGSLGMAGAAVLAAKSALRSGAGTATLLCPGEIYNVCAAMVPEIMVVPCGSAGMFYPGQECISAVKHNIKRAGVVIIGPGWGRGYFQTQFLKEILPFASKKTTVVDADALFALEQLGGLSYLARIEGNFILTPHPGELSVLTGLSIEELERDRPGYAREASRQSNSIMCLKGAGTCTAEPSGRLFVNTSGGPYMATAGSGDVLTGVIAALVAQGLPSYTSAWLGVFWHGLAGEAALKREGSYGILAGDIIECLPEARSWIEQEFDRLRKEANGQS
ncbi:MAG TPA: NAD(P)H-hydrate dehydratase [Firmicutes bacterium]|nr:NAD(P)H-hydrate dehydratase [Candidatus Fermentithermobacillaceae bacterium]